MNLISQLLEELGADEARAVTVCPGVCAFLRGVKAVAELTPEKIVLACRGGTLTVEGDKLRVAEYFQGDMIIRGSVKRVCFE